MGRRRGKVIKRSVRNAAMKVRKKAMTIAGIIHLPRVAKSIFSASTPALLNLFKSVLFPAFV